ncbi:MAG: WD40 repeat domain-containing serine/threonine protein kinase, partial [Planctomycetia bacterium]
MLRRFGYEAELLGRLRHPGIAQIFSAGTHDVDGATVPYFVMEYIDSPRTLVQYADEKRLSTHARLALFQKVCDAVAHGHQRGVIHRDLKPGNILVDAAGEPKVIDFGVARATDSDVAITTMQTDVGQLIGILQYMSPEQFDANPDDVDVRSDVYSLGIVLYELLAGKPPYDVRRKAVFEIARVVREEEPTPLSQLNRTLRRDVAVIAETCLRKERHRRYSSAAELGEDVSRYLAGEPIVARSTGFFQGLLRLARRHKVAAAGVAGVLAAALVAAVVTSVLAYEAVRHRRTADRERGRAEAQRERSDLTAYASQLSLTEYAQKYENTLRTSENLDACQWNLRGWEYRHVWNRIHGRRVFHGHTGPVRAVAASPDGGRFASAGDDGTLRIWDGRSGGQIAVLPLGAAIRCLAWHPRDERILAGCDDHTAHVVAADGTTPAVRLGDLEGPVRTVAWRSDGGQYLLCTPAAITLHDAVGGQRQVRIADAAEAIQAAGYSPDGARVVSAGMPAGQPRTGPEGWKQDGGPRTTIRIRSAEGGEEILAIPDLPGEATTVAYTPDGTRIISSTFNHHRKFFGKSLEACELRSWDAETGRPVVTFAGHHDAILAVACSPDGGRIASANGDFDNSVRLWNTETGKELRQFKGVRAAVHAVAFTGDGSRLLVGTENAELRVWDVASEGQPRQFRGHETRVNGLTFSADGRHLASCDGYPQKNDKPGTINVWETGSARVVATLTGHESLVWAVAFSPDGGSLASVGTDHTLRLWDWRAGRETASYPGEYGCGAYHPGGRIIAAGGNGVLDLRDAVSGDVVHRIASEGRWCRSVAFRPDGRELTAAWDSDVVLYDPETAVEQARLPGHAQLIWSLAYSPDGSSIASAAGIINKTNAAGEWKVWDTRARSERFGGVVPGGGFRGIAWTPDGSRVITGGFDMKLSSWDSRHGQLLHSVPTYSLIFSLASSPDGTSIACGTHSKGVLVFDAVPIEDCRVLHAPMDVVTEAWFTADGRFIVARDDQGRSRAWAATTGPVGGRGGRRSQGDRALEEAERPRPVRRGVRRAGPRQLEHAITRGHPARGGRPRPRASL